ncbi:MAG TPA: phage holin family protein [Candidatus Acidoferrum sp.]
MAQQNLQNGRSMAEVLQDIVANIQEIFRSEFRLAKAEIHEETTKIARSSIPLGVGVLLALYAFGFILLAAVHALGTVVDAWLAALIVGVTVLVISMILVSIGRKRLKEVKVVPEKTIGTVKENVQWARHQIR